MIDNYVQQITDAIYFLANSVRYGFLGLGLITAIGFTVLIWRQRKETQ